MNKDLIKSFVIRNKYYTEELSEGYKIPRYIISRKSGKKISLVEARNELLNKVKSNYEPSFIYDVSILKGKAIERKPLYNYIREFPVVIEDLELWNEILDILEISKEDKMRNTNYFILDFLFYESDFIVEIDSEYHDGREIYDKARDLYIKNKYGLDTLRFYKYGLDDIDRVTYQAAFKKKIKDSYNVKIKLGLIYGRSILDFTETVVNNYILENKQGLLFIDSLSRFLGKEFKIKDNLEIKYIDLPKIFPKVFKRNNPDKTIEELNLNNYKSVLYDIYKKTLKILPDIKA